MAYIHEKAGLPLVVTTLSVYRRRTMTWAKVSLTSCKNTKVRILGGVPIGADHDPTFQRDSVDAGMS